MARQWEVILMGLVVQSEIVEELERKISYRKHYDCQIDQIDMEAKFVIMNLCNIENGINEYPDTSKIIWLKKLSNLAKQRTIDEDKRNELSIARYIARLGSEKK